jgi:hypothetical protein
VQALDKKETPAGEKATLEGGKEVATAEARAAAGEEEKGAADSAAVLREAVAA